MESKKQCRFSFFSIVGTVLLLALGCESTQPGGAAKPNFERKAETTARSCLRNYKAKSLSLLAMKAHGQQKDFLREVGRKGKKHPQFNAFFTGWRWEAVQNWKGRILDLRFRLEGDLTIARARFLDLDGDRIAVVVLHLIQGKWCYIEIAGMSRAEFEKDEVKFPSGQSPEPETEPEPEPIPEAGGAVDLATLNRGNAGAVVNAILALFKSRNLALLAGLCRGENREFFADVGAKGESHPEYNGLFSGWRWEAITAWPGNVGEIRYWRFGERVKAQVHFGKTQGGRLAVVVLWFVDGAWWFEDINSASREKFAKGEIKFPRTGAPGTPAPLPAGPPVDLGKIDRTDVAATFKAILLVFRSRNLASLLDLTVEKKRKYMAEIAGGGTRHPGYRYFYSGWRWSAIQAWDGSVSEIRYWRIGNRVKAEVRLGGFEGKIVVIVLFLVERKWWFFDIVRTSPTAFETGAESIPTLRELKPVPELVLAANNNDLEKVRDLLAGGADPESTHKGWTALLFASQNGHAAVVEVLAASGADLDIRGEENVTPMYMAAQNGHMAVAKILGERGANPNLARRNGWTPLHVAADKGSASFAELLIAKGAGMNAKDNEGWTPLHLAAQRGHTGTAKILLAEGADVNGGTHRGWTALHIAGQNGHMEVVKILLASMAKINARDDRKWTPLLIAAHKGQSAVVELLLDRGANVNAAEGDGWTALHLAAQGNSMKAAGTLIAKGANVNAKIKQGATPLDIAGQRGHQAMVELLKKHGGQPGK